jgi:5-methylcytosine-specific restriction endonuclease McrA
MTEKRCSACGETKLTSAFHRHPRNQFDHRCKACVSERDKRRVGTRPGRYVYKARPNRKRPPADPVKARANRRAYEARHREERAAARAARRAGFRGSEVDYFLAVRRDPCAYCGADGGTIDHIVPIAKGGDSDHSNVTGACTSCNCTKRETHSLLGFLLRRVAQTS